jgi:hypothetical protein
LAFLDEPAAAAPLAQAAREEPAFRAFALAALGAMEDVAAYDELRDLLAVSSAETRYGAFRALWSMNPQDALVRGEQFDTGFSYHVLEAGGPPMIHATRSFRPELVVFGGNQRLKTPLVLEAGRNIMINARSGEEVTVSRFAVGEADEKRIVSTRLDDVIRAVVELGGSYPDVVQMLQQAKESAALEGRFEVDAVPKAGRTYTRARPEDGDTEALADADDDDSTSGESASTVDATAVISAPQPDLFGRESPAASLPRGDDEAQPAKSDPPAEGFFARILNRDAQDD